MSKFGAGNQMQKNKVDPSIKVLRDTCRDRIIEMAHKICVLSKVELVSHLKKPDATALEHFTANALAKNNAKYVQWLLEMAVGKPKQQVNVTDDGAIRRVMLNYNLDPNAEVIDEKKD